MLRFTRLFTVLLLMALILSACQPIQAPAPGVAPQHAMAYTPRFEPAACTYTLPAEENVECGYLIVPEDRSRLDGPTIRLYVLNFKSKGEQPAPDPIIVVNGGPGGAGLAIVNLWLYPPIGNALRRERDNIVLEYRGSNFSEPALYCPEMQADLADLAGMTYGEEVAWSAEAIRTCYDRLVQEGHNLSAYHMLATALDLADLRLALGYDQVNVYGVSCGSLLAMIWMRERPVGLRSVVLDGVVLPEINWVNQGLESANGAFAALCTACAADPACHAAYPDLEDMFYAVLERLRLQPAEVTVTGSDGQRYTVIMEDLKFVNYVWYGLSLHTAAALPASIEAAYHGDYQAVTQAWLNYLSDRHSQMGPGTVAWTHGVYYSMSCLHDGSNSDVTTARAIYAGAGGDPSVQSWATTHFITDTLAVCQHWQVAAPDRAREITPLTSAIPSLLLVGTFDATTPPYFSRPAAARLSHSYYYELPIGHGAIVTQCGLNLIEQFFADPLQAPDSSCIETMKVEWVLPR